METLLSLSGGTLLGTVGMLAAATSIITEVLKAILPKKFPTKVLAMIISFIVTFVYVIFLSGTAFGVTAIITSIFGGFVVSFISMFGFDQFKDIISRFTGGEKDNGDKL